MTTPGAEKRQKLDLHCVNPTLDAVYEVLSDRSLRKAVMDTDHDARAWAMDKLGFDMGARPALLQVLTVARVSDVPTEAAQPANTQNGAAFDKEQAQWRKIGLRPFAQIKTAYFISVAMSVTLFLCGIILFFIAALRSILQGTADSASLLIAGLGAVDFVALIYTRPLKDIASNLASTQRATMIASSYLGGLSLIDPHEPGALDRLEQLTKTALDQPATKPPV